MRGWWRPAAVLWTIVMITVGCAKRNRNADCSAFISRVNTTLNPIAKSDPSALPDEKSAAQAMSELARLYEGLSHDVGALKLRTEEFKIHQVAYQQVVRRAAATLHELAEAIEKRDLARKRGAEEEFGRIVEQEKGLVTQINAWCER